MVYEVSVKSKRSKKWLDLGTVRAGSLKSARNIAYVAMVDWVFARLGLPFKVKETCSFVGCSIYEYPRGELCVKVQGA